VAGRATDRLSVGPIRAPANTRAAAALRALQSARFATGGAAGWGRAKRRASLRDDPSPDPPRANVASATFAEQSLQRLDRETIRRPTRPCTAA